MAGKSNKGKNRRGSSNSVNSNVRVNSSDAPLKENLSSSEPYKVDKNGNATMTESTQTQAKLEVKGSEKIKSEPMQGEIHLYPVFVKTQGGEKFELQLSPLDSVMDVRQFLLDAPETCFFTCYDLVLCTKDGSAPHLEDYNEISEVADITTSDCSLEMVAASYDDRSIRVHFDRARQLLSVSSPYTSVSTLLVLQHETGQGTQDSAKPQVSELEDLGYMEDISGSLTNLLSSASNELKCVESLVFSSFNPPPRHRRLSGDLVYLDVITLEGNKYCITGTTKTFYINSSTGNVLDPRPNKAVSEATTLIGLLQKISPKFKKAFREILEQKASAHPFEIVQAPLSPNSWIGLYPVPDHKRDAARAENALTLTFGSELIGMQRDWNEELQSCWEFPHVTSQERILRERALYKVSSDFVDAATSGAIGVINRCIPPINPADPECFHMYVHNNIFFSFAVDADLEQLKKQASDANLKAEEGVEALQISIEKATNKSLHCTDKSNGSSTGEHNVVMDLATDVTSETQLAESEQATYASANNDLKGTRAFQEADIPGLYNLAMAIIDYRGHRVVAQSVLPGILQGDKSDSLLYGSVDNGKKVSWNEEFHSKVLEASKRLHLKEHTVLDGSGNVFRLAAPMECKGIIGSDDRHYLLDLMRATPRDANYTGPADRFCILRPELITTLCQAEEAKRLKSKCRSEGEVSVAMDSPKVDNTEEHGRFEDTMTEQKVDTSRNCGYQPSGSGEILEEILFNPNVLMGFKLAGSPEELHVDEDNVRKASTYLRDFVLPKFVQDLCSLEVSPMDGHTLTEALHAHGINVRYIGKIADGTKQLPHLWDLCSNEIVVRSAKHILKDILRDTEDHDLSKAISHFLNCFFGYYQAVDIEGVVNSTQSRKQKKDHGGHTSSGKYSRGQGKWKNTRSFKKKQSSYMLISSDSLWSDIQEFAKLKYQFELPQDARSRVKKISVIRNFCQKVGITIAARKYDFDNLAPFQTSDILNLQPVVKQSVPVCSEAKVLVETGKAQLAEGLLTEAYKLFSEAFTILQQVTGPMHREVANCCRYLAMVLYHAGDMAGAIMQQHKELIINERCLGLDHPDTAHSYGNMALFYHGLNQTELALRHMSRALLLLSLSSGPDHPDVASTYINVAMMYQDIGKMNTALRYLQEALKKNERLLGEEHIHTAVCYHALAIAFNCMGAYKLSHQHEKKTYEILVKQLGEEDSRTQDSKNWMNTFKKREAQLNAQKQKGQALDAASAQKAIDILKANPDLIHAFQTAATGGGVVNSSTLNAAIMGDPLPRGRGVDERAARATAEVRKKAAARGLLIRPHGVPIQTLPPVTHLLNAINSGMTPEAMNSEETDCKKKEVNGHPCDKPARDAQENKSELGQQDQGPVGLGTGLAVLNSKKQKPKAEVTS